MSLATFFLLQLDTVRRDLDAARWEYKRRLFVATRRDDLAALYRMVADGPAWSEA